MIIILFTYSQVFRRTRVIPQSWSYPFAQTQNTTVRAQNQVLVKPTVCQVRSLKFLALLQEMIKKWEMWLLKRNSEHMGKGEIITRKINKCEIKGDCKNLYKKQGQTSMGQEAFCLYCGKSQANISRHLQRKHMEMAELAYAFSCPLSSKERKSLFETTTQ